MKHWLFIVITIAMTACAASIVPTTEPEKASYPDLGIAPDLAGNTWLNTDFPQKLADLRGKVILVDMWTFG